VDVHVGDAAEGAGVPAQPRGELVDQHRVHAPPLLFRRRRSGSGSGSGCGAGGGEAEGGGRLQRAATRLRTRPSSTSMLPIALHVETMKIGHLQADFHGRAESTVENLCVIIKVVDQTISDFSFLF
jgi:hypothetical protein